MNHALDVDLAHILSKTQHLFREMRGARIFITGGTGFFGCWLLESFARANSELALGAEAVVLTRDPQAFHRKAPHLASHPAIRLHQGDVRTFEFPEGSFTHVIHASAESNLERIAESPLLLFTTHADGARRVFEFATRCRAQGVLFTSSGAVYGRQSPEISHLSEEFTAAPEILRAPPAKAANAGGIWCAELYGALYAAEHSLPVKVARCFTLLGPYLPLTKPFAATSFLRNALAGEPISVAGDGTAYRSYLYAADLVIWLWTILLKGKPAHAYNVGSEQALTIGELAHEVARVVSPGAEVRITAAPQPGQPPERYVPSTKKAQLELGLQQWISLPEAIERTANWHRQSR